MKHSIATVISFCSNDYQCLRPNILSVKKFSNQIIVPYCDHFYNGEPEDFKIIAKAIKENPEAQFIKFTYDPKATRNIWRGWTYLFRLFGHHKVYGPLYWCCYNNQVGFQAVKKNIDYVLFLDTDEIIDSTRFLPWLDTKQYQNYNVLRLGNFWYWRKPIYQSTSYEAISILAKRTVLVSTNFITHAERHGMYQSIPQPKKDMVMGLNNKPMIHHYGWAKPKANLLKKVRTWGHSKDRNWVKLIEKEFKKDFDGTDFLGHNQYKTVKPFLNIPASSRD
jgi:hypothetical protein